MSDHKLNPQTALAATLPALLPPGYRAGANMQLQVMPSVNVLLVPPDRMRTVGDKAEVMDGAGLWVAPPEGAIIHELGKPLPPEKCDMAVIVGTMVEDMAGPRLVLGDGQKPHGKVSAGPMAIIARMPLLLWQARHGVA